MKMWSHSLSTNSYSKFVSTNVAGTTGIRFLLVSLATSLIVPTVVLGAYDMAISHSMSAFESSNEKFPAFTTGGPTQPTGSNETSIEALNQTNGTSSTTKLKVNNQPISVPENGSTTQRIDNDNGTTKVDISVNSESTGSAETNSSSTMNIQLNTTTEAESSSSSGPE